MVYPEYDRVIKTDGAKKQKKNNQKKPKQLMVQGISCQSSG